MASTEVRSLASTTESSTIDAGMRSRPLILFFIALVSLQMGGREIRDTVRTAWNDRIILTYDISYEGNEVTLDFASHPRILPSQNLDKACKGEYDKLKVVLFDRVGGFGKVKWSGTSPTAFMVPSSLTYDKTSEGYYILGECQPLSFTKTGTDKIDLRLPLYIAVYEKKNKYRLVTPGSSSLVVSLKSGLSGRPYPNRGGASATETVTVQTSQELEADNEEITGALSSIEMVRELLSREEEIPFSQTLQMEIYNLRTLKNKISEPEIIEKINEVLLLCSDRERELKESQNAAALAAKAEQQALLTQQRQEEAAREQEAQEKARIQEEKQQKRTFWMVIGAVLLGILGFICNAVFKHFRDLRNQKSILQMQESLTKQAEHEATRRSREMIRNKAHGMANAGRNKMRETIKNVAPQTKKSTRRSI